MRCNGAGLARFHEWKVNSPGPLIVAVRRLNTVLMDARLKRLIADYQAAVVRAVEALEATGIPRPASTSEWVGYDVPGRGALVGGGEYFIHGFGCAVRSPDVNVDFEFGDDGQIDGFDWDRLSRFAGTALPTVYGIQDENLLRRLFDASCNDGELVDSGYILWYLASPAAGAEP